MIIKQFINSIFSSNTFVISEGHNVVIIDMGDFQPIMDYLTQNNLSPVALLITHVHYDHFYGIPEFMNFFSEVPIFTTKEGIESFKNPKWNFSKYHDNPISIDTPQIKIFREILSIPLIGEIKGIYTPGHDHSCMTYQIGNKLFTGDSYIPGIRVVDNFPRSDKKLAREWYVKLEEISKSCDIYPGHGDIKRIKG